MASLFYALHGLYPLPSFQQECSPCRICSLAARCSPGFDFFMAFGLLCSQEEERTSEEAAGKPPQKPHKTTQTQDSARSLYLSRASTAADSVPNADARLQSNGQAGSGADVVDLASAESAVGSTAGDQPSTTSDMPSTDEICEVRRGKHAFCDGSTFTSFGTMCIAALAFSVS